MCNLYLVSRPGRFMHMQYTAKAGSGRAILVWNLEDYIHSMKLMLVGHGTYQPPSFNFF